MLIKDLYSSITQYINDTSIIQFIFIYNLNVNIRFRDKYEYTCNYYKKIRPNKIVVCTPHLNLSSLPYHITHLYIKSHAIGIIPETVTHVILWHDLTKNVIRRLPTSLKYLELNSVITYFTVDCDSHELPRNLTHFICNRIFNGDLNDLPDSLTHLTITGNYPKSIKKVPKSLKEFWYKKCGHHSVNNVSDYITHLSCISLCTWKCPKFLQHLEIIADRYEHEDEGTDYNFKRIPKSLKSLTFGNFFNGDIILLPNRLKMLTFGLYFNQPVDNLPRTLIFLKFGNWFTKNVNNLPASIEVLIFGYYFNSSVNNLPLNLRYLEFGVHFNQKIVHLPPNITYLSLGYYFDKS